MKNLRKIRIEKLRELVKKGINPYPSQAKKTHTCQEAVLDFEKLTKKERIITLAGRLKNIRLHGGSCFCHLGDESGKIQIYLKKDILNQELQAVNYEFFKDLIDIGDFIEATGTLFKTKKGEKTLLVKEFKLLTKSLLPLPEKWHGLKEVEIRYRKRYLDLISNPKVKEIFQKRSLIIKTLREFLDSRDFIEVETPILQLIPGGTTARPFKTHHQALDIDLYLRIAPELYLKKLLVGDFEKVYEIGRCFRNEGIDWSHNPEFTICEFYWAYKNYHDLMDFTEELITYLIKKINESLKIKYKDNILDFSRPWLRKSFIEAVKGTCGIDIVEISQKDLIKEMKKLKIESDYKVGLNKLYDDLYKDIIRAKIIQPTIIYDYPIEMEPLAKKCEDNPRFVQRFQLIAAGLELVKAYTELNDPQDQLIRFKEQQKLREKGDEEAQKLDKDFIEALEHGLPPCAGWGLGIDRLIMLLTDTRNLKEVILFPTMRPIIN
jgi:lysyl-tRNA synthetase class 2